MGADFRGVGVLSTVGFLAGREAKNLLLRGVGVFLPGAVLNCIRNVGC